MDSRMYTNSNMAPYLRLVFVPYEMLLCRAVILLSLDIDSI